MCGIVGIVAAWPISDRDALDTMRDTMRHRGPDDAGSWWSSDGRIGLAHRRLSIIDLSPGGHQPMTADNQTQTIVFNGEIYNHHELRRQLEAGGHKFKSTSDTEVLLAAYRRWGTNCLEKLNGMFAFCIYDAEKQLLFLARDRTGEKPLFYWQENGDFRFASELKALMAADDFPRKIDHQALNHYLAFGYVPGDMCMLRGVKKLPQAHAMTYDISSGRVKVWPYWQLPQTAAETADENELTDRLHELLAESVRLRMIADVPVGILLSGGIDSSLVTAMAAEVSSAPVKTYTIAFPGHGSHDEGPYAKMVAGHFSTEHTELVAEPATVDMLPELARQYDEPIADSSMVPTYMVSRLIRQEATVALGGDGGDELFGGYPGHSWILQMARARRFLPRPLRRAGLAAIRRFMPLGKKGRNYLLGLMADLPESITQINLYFDALNRSRLLGQSVRPDGGLLEPEAMKNRLQLPYATPLQKITALDFQTFLVDDIMAKVDRASMLTSLEVRAPFLDHQIIEFAYSAVPDNLRATVSEKKILTRRLAAKLLPSQLDLERKQGFSLPLQSWFQSHWGRYCENILRDAPAELFRREAIERLFAQQKRGYLHTQRIFALTIFELWRREYNIQVG
ncbi:MAG: asparagine synthase (glutamine-hydrolyzing) [Phycisphaerae bacterium]|nr:asparagine synthase (glutamine-hydrolyzing) [Phycisphaerae bacterium]